MIWWKIAGFGLVVWIICILAFIKGIDNDIDKDWW